jgi:tetratricopeptide (TPR) repeat protein
MASTENYQSTLTYHRFLDPLDFCNIERLRKVDIQFVWIDRHCRDDDLGSLLHEIDPSSHFFNNLTSAVGYLSNNKNSLQFFVIVSGEFSEEMIQLSDRLSQIHSLFIYCLNVEKYQHLKDKSLKLLTICDDRSELINWIEKAQKSASIAIVRQCSMRDLSKESATFIWFQLLKSLIAKLTTDTEEMARNDLKQEIKDYYYDNKIKLEALLEEVELYDPSNVIFCYTRPASISNIINQALRRQDIDLLYKCRLFIRDLSQALTELRQDLPAGLRVYRGTVLSRESFDKLKHIVRQRTFVSTFGYLSTTKNLEIAKMFASNQKSGTSENGVSVMFEIDIDNDTNVIAADISQNSEFPDEEEVLFDIDSIFEILETKIDEEKQTCTIRMRTSSHGSELASEYLRYNETELNELNVELLFGRLITDMGQFDKSINYFERLVDKEHIDQTNVRINLGRAYALKGDYDNAYKYYHAARDLETDESSLKMADIIHKLGWLDNILGDFNSAIEKYRKSLELYNKIQSSGYWQIKGDLHTNIAMAQTALSHFDEAKQELDSSYECMVKAKLPPNHPDFSQHQINHGKICQRRGDYKKADQHYNEALEMRKRALPPGHLDIGKAFYSLGSVTGEAGIDYEKALTYLRESLVITENAVGEEHPATALVWSGIANVFECRDEHEQSLTYQLKVLELYQKIYDNKDHEDTALVLNNIGELYRRMKKYEKAFLYLNQALEMRIKVLGADHFNTGTVHVNLAETYRDTNNYQTAIQHAERGMELWRKKLLPSAIYMKEGEALLVELRRLISQKDPIGKKDG